MPWAFTGKRLLAINLRSLGRFSSAPPLCSTALCRSPHSQERGLSLAAPGLSLATRLAANLRARDGWLSVLRGTSGRLWLLDDGVRFEEIP
jgi:hypothetical protein